MKMFCSCFRIGWGARLLLAGLAGALAMSLGYVLLFSALVPNLPVPSAKELLLFYAPAPRLIIDSGSSAVHGLDPTKMGIALNRVGLLASDSGNVSPIDKGWRLLAAARPGDLVVLPLEWLDYDQPDRLDLPYLTVATGVLSQYYLSAPWTERLRMLSKLPPVDALRIMRGNFHTDRQAQPPYLTLSMFLLFHTGWDGSGTEEAKKLLPEAETVSCSDYLFTPGQLRRIPNDTTLRSLFAPLRQLRKNGVTVVLTPPIVAGNGCYARDDITRYWAAIQAAAAHAGLQTLGDPLQLWFGTDQLTNTYYHVARDARRQATDRVTSWLRQAGLTAAPHPAHALDEAAFALEQKIGNDNWPHATAPGRVIAADDARMGAIAGWWFPVGGARWMYGADGILHLRFAQNIHQLQLTLAAVKPNISIDISINGGAPVTYTISKTPTPITLSVDPAARQVSIALHVNQDAVQAEPPRSVLLVSALGR